MMQKLIVFIVALALPISRTDAQVVALGAGDNHHPNWSPDGTRLIYHSDRTGTNQLYVMDADGSNPTRLTHTDYDESSASWSPDGSKIAFKSERRGTREVYVMNADGSNLTQLTTDMNAHGPPAWSPDGTKLAFHSSKTGTSEIYTIRIDGSELTQLTHSSSDVAFTLPERDLIPEGITYDPVEKAFYVSSTYKRKIVKIDSSGASSDFTSSSQDGLWGVVGMEVDSVRRVLWAASSHAGTGMPMVDMDPDEEGTAGVFKYDLTTGRLIKKYVLGTESKRHFLNDLTVSSQGTVYVTDSGGRALYRISAERDSLEVFLNPLDMASPNGITLSEDEQLLFIALNGEVGRIVLSTGAFSLLRLPEEIEVKADGLYFFKESLIAIWPWSEGREVSRYQLNSRLDAIEHVEVLAGNHPAFIQPTTGVIVEGDLYYIANSQLQTFSRLYNEEAAHEWDQLREPVILRLALGD